MHIVNTMQLITNNITLSAGTHNISEHHMAT